MAVTYPLSLPSAPEFTNVRFRPMVSVGSVRSDFSFVEQVHDWGGDMWAVDLELPRMKRPAAEQWISTFLKLRGRKGTFLLGDPDGASPRGTPTGTPVLNGAHSARDQVISLKGMTANATGNFLEGDYIQLGTGSSSRLHKILEQVDADASGEAAEIAIFPALRADYADGASITYSSAKGLFRLAANEMPWNSDLLTLYSISFSAEEAVG